LAVTVALIAYLCLRISFREVLSAFAGLHPGWLVLAFANALLGRYFISYQTSYAMRVYGVRYSAWQMFSITLRTLFYGSFLPGEIGAAGVKWFLISKMDGLRAETFAAMVYLRLNQLIILLGMGIVAIMIKWPFPSRALFPLAWAALVVLLLAVISLHSRYQRPAVEFLQRRSFYRRLPTALIRRMNNVFESFQAISRFSLGAMILIWLWSLAFKLSVTVSFWLIGFSLGIHVDFLTLIWVNSVVEIVHLLPISIAGLGPREASMVYMLSLRGIPDSMGLAFSLIIFVLRILVALLGGVLVLVGAIGAAQRART
jgi:hypothetical protein